jgi:excisionase family DNA binding protein
MSTAERITGIAAMPALLSVREAADRVNISEATVRRMVSDGKIPHVRLGLGEAGAIRIRPSALAPWLGDQAEPAG